MYSNKNKSIIKSLNLLPKIQSINNEGVQWFQIGIKKHLREYYKLKKVMKESNLVQWLLAKHTSK